MLLLPSSPQIQFGYLCIERYVAPSNHHELSLRMVIFIVGFVPHTITCIHGKRNSVLVSFNRNTYQINCNTPQTAFGKRQRRVHITFFQQRLPFGILFSRWVRSEGSWLNWISFSGLGLGMGEIWKKNPLKTFERHCVPLSDIRFRLLRCHAKQLGLELNITR